MKFVNKKISVIIIGSFICLLFLIYGIIKGSYWHALDYKFNDWLYKVNLKKERSLERNQILYLTITDLTYHNIFKSSKFNRKVFSEILDKVISLEPEFLLLDLIFAFRSDPDSDSSLYNVLLDKNFVYLGIALTDDVPNFHFTNDFISGKIRKPAHSQELSKWNSYIPDIFIGKGDFKYGHINVYPDQDGLYRHSSVLHDFGSFYVPSLPLRVFLDYCRVSPDKVYIDKNNNIIIPCNDNSWINKNIIIPTDDQKRMYVPYRDIWGKDFMHLSFNRFLELYAQPDKRSELSDLIAGRIIIVGDISTGTSDLASTPLDNNVPLISLFANELNTYIEGNYYTELDQYPTVLIAVLLFLLLSAASIKRSKFFYYAGTSALFLLIVSGIILVSYNYFLPLSTLMIYTLGLFGALFTYLSYSDFRDNKTLREEIIIKKYEFEEAKKLQLSLLPQSIPETDYFELIASLKTASEVGGDFYDISYEKQRTTILLGDVVGHGLKAGMMSLVIKTIFLSAAQDQEILSILRKIHFDIKNLHLKRFFAGIILVRVEQNKLYLVSAGMPPVLFYKFNEGKLKEIVTTSLPIGSINFQYEVREIDTQEGDTFIFYSDGLIELFNNKEEMLGLDRVKKILENSGKFTLEDLSGELERQLNGWSGDCKLYDDVSYILLKIK